MGGDLEGAVLDRAGDTSPANGRCVLSEDDELGERDDVDVVFSSGLEEVLSSFCMLGHVGEKVTEVVIVGVRIVGSRCPFHKQIEQLVDGERRCGERLGNGS